MKRASIRILKAIATCVATLVSYVLAGPLAAASIGAPNHTRLLRDTSPEEKPHLSKEKSASQPGQRRKSLSNA